MKIVYEYLPLNKINVHVDCMVIVFSDIFIYLPLHYIYNNILYRIHPRKYIYNTFKVIIFFWKQQNEALWDRGVSSVGAWGAYALYEIVHRKFLPLKKKVIMLYVFCPLLFVLPQGDKEGAKTFFSPPTKSVKKIYLHLMTKMLDTLLYSVIR